MTVALFMLIFNYSSTLGLLFWFFFQVINMASAKHSVSAVLTPIHGPIPAKVTGNRHVCKVLLVCLLSCLPDHAHFHDRPHTSVTSVFIAPWCSGPLWLNEHTPELSHCHSFSSWVVKRKWQILRISPCTRLGAGTARYIFSVIFAPTGRYADGAAGALRGQVSCWRSHSQEVQDGKSRRLCFAGISIWGGLVRNTVQMFQALTPLHTNGRLMWSKCGLPQSSGSGEQSPSCLVVKEIDSHDSYHWRRDITTVTANDI